jgi:predicted RNA-binding protein with TRAM domain
MNLYVRDFRKPGMNDDDSIAACLKHCSTLNEPAVVILDGADWHIDNAILLSDNMTIIIDGCAIKQNNGAFDNVFRGANVKVDPLDPYGWPLSIEPLKNVKVLGKNGARVIGPDVNRRGFHPVLNKEQDMVGDYWGWRTLQVCLSKCAGFEIGGLSFFRTRCWTMAFDRCSEGDVHDIHIETYVKNGDGVDFEPGCRHCRVRNITGRTADDSVSLHGIIMAPNGLPHKNYLYPMQLGLQFTVTGEFDPAELATHDIEISDIVTAGDMHGVICNSFQGLQIYNVTIRNVREVGEGKRRAAVEFYTGYGYAEGYSPGDMHDITVEGISAKFSQFAYMCNTQVKNITLRDIKHTKPGAEVLSLAYPEGFKVE